jgi:hypothetical protein
MAPDERKSRDLVIEILRLPPAGFTMALLAAATELTLVSVVFLMTGNACRRQLVAVQIASVAGIALDLSVCRSQRKFCRPIVIKVDGHPFVLIVTATAFHAIPPEMHILNLMAIDTLGTDAPVALPNMARGAGDDPMRALQRKPGPIVVEGLDATPRDLGMTIVAGLAKSTFVPIVRLVAVEAASRRVAKLYRLPMATVALHCFVRVFQLEIRKCMIEGLAVELDDVGISPLVIGVAMAAILRPRVRLPAVKASSELTIRGDFLVAGGAE